MKYLMWSIGALQFWSSGVFAASDDPHRAALTFGLGAVSMVGGWVALKTEESEHEHEGWTRGFDQARSIYGGGRR